MRNIFPFQVSVNSSVYSHNKLDQLIIAQSSRYQPHKSRLALGLAFHFNLSQSYNQSYCWSQGKPGKFLEGLDSSLINLFIL